jgi:predicted DNA-binding transcriptional regulator YafY
MSKIEHPEEEPEWFHDKDGFWRYRSDERHYGAVGEWRVPDEFPYHCIAFEDYGNPDARTALENDILTIEIGKEFVERHVRDYRAEAAASAPEAEMAQAEMAQAEMAQAEMAQAEMAQAEMAQTKVAEAAVAETSHIVDADLSQTGESTVTTAQPLATQPFETQQAKQAKIVYTNYKGETAIRLIQPLHIFFGSTPWHPRQQWFLKAYDVEKGEERDFAMTDIRAWLHS